MDDPLDTHSFDVPSRQLNSLEKMTAQIPDVFRYEGETYSLVGIKGEGFFKVEELRLNLVMDSTSCWRGNVKHYNCINGQLVLDRLDIRTQEEPPEINGVNAGPPVKRIVNEQKGFGFFSHSHINLGLKSKFTGLLLFGKDFIEGIYVHMGYQRPLSFETLLEIQVQDGDIITVSNRSEEMTRLRMIWRDKGSFPDSDSGEDLKRWIDYRFSLDYGF
ncbi:MAG: hypothetical protein P1Q69_07830 [Candidatus Thorarchaeota archaeon]|nr:hypothetical protein [Candidatus Thorarchaeota archaeon]